MLHWPSFWRGFLRGLALQPLPDLFRRWLRSGR